MTKAPLSFDQAVTWEIVTKGERLEQVARELVDQRAYAWDVETSGRSVWHGSRIVGHSFAWRQAGQLRAVYIPCRHKALETELFSECEQLLPELVSTVLKPILEGPAQKTGHNISFDIHHARPDGIRVAPPYVDTLAGCRLIDERWHNHQLQTCLTKSGITHESGWKKTIQPQINDRAKRMKTAPKEWVAKYGYQYLTVPVLGRYGCQDAAYELLLGEWVLPQQAPWQNIWQLEMDLLPVLLEMEDVGVPVDTAALSRLADKERARMATLEPKIFALAGCEFELTNDTQVRDVLYKKLGYIPPTETEKGAASIGDDALWHLEKEGREIAPLLRQWNASQKIVSTYTGSILERVDSHGILHTEIDSGGTRTGRMSSRNPNLQNIPVRTGVGRQVRQAFIARPGMVRYCLDYCLPGDTEIITPDGVKSIREIISEEGSEKVLSCSPEGVLGFKEVERGARIGVKPVVEVELSGGEMIRCTADHEWMRLGGEKVKARDLRPGDRLRHVRLGRAGTYPTWWWRYKAKYCSRECYHGNNYRVVAVREAGEDEVFHLTVADWHTFVLANGLVSFNSQIELRVLAHLSQDPLLLKIYHEGLDAHRISAIEAFGTAEVVDGVDMRRIAKILNFGVSFGMTYIGLMGNVNKDLPEGAPPITEEQAKGFIDRFYAKYAGVSRFQRYLSYQVAAAPSHEFRNLFGRPRRMGDGFEAGAEKWKRRAEERQAVSSMVQGSAADLVKHSMVACWQYLKAQTDCEAYMVLMVHDDLQFDTAVDGSARMVRELQRLMEQTCQAKLSVPIIADVEWFNTHWADKHKMRGL